MAAKRYTHEERIEIINEVCRRLIDGEALRAIFKPKTMPHVVTFFEWLEDNKELGKRYARAMQFRSHLLFEEIIEEANEEPERTDTKFGTCVDTGWVQNKRVRIEAKKWVVAKMNPQVYGNNFINDDDEDNEIIVTRK